MSSGIPAPSHSSPAYLSAYPPSNAPACRRRVAGRCARDRQESDLIDSFLRSFDLVVPTEADGLSALDLYRRFRLSNGVDWPDRQIAATALRLGTEVFTQNVKHFTAFPGVRVVRAY